MSVTSVPAGAACGAISPLERARRGPRPPARPRASHAYAVRAFNVSIHVHESTQSRQSTLIPGRGVCGNGCLRRRPVTRLQPRAEREVVTGGGYRPWLRGVTRLKPHEPTHTAASEHRTESERRPQTPVPAMCGTRGGPVAIWGKCGEPVAIWGKYGTGQLPSGASTACHLGQVRGPPRARAPGGVYHPAAHHRGDAAAQVLRAV